MIGRKKIEHPLYFWRDVVGVIKSYFLSEELPIVLLSPKGSSEKNLRRINSKTLVPSTPLGKYLKKGAGDNKT